MFKNLTDTQFWLASVIVSVSFGTAATAAYRMYMKYIRWKRDKEIEDDIVECKRLIAAGELDPMEDYVYEDMETWRKACERFREEGINVCQAGIEEFPGRPKDNVYSITVTYGKSGNTDDE